MGNPGFKAFPLLDPPRRHICRWSGPDVDKTVASEGEKLTRVVQARRHDINTMRLRWCCQHTIRFSGKSLIAATCCPSELKAAQMSGSPIDPIELAALTSSSACPLVLFRRPGGDAAGPSSLGLVRRSKLSVRTRFGSGRASRLYIITWWMLVCASADATEPPPPAVLGGGGVAFLAGGAR